MNALDLLRLRLSDIYPSQPQWGAQRDPGVFGGTGGQPSGDVVLPSPRTPFMDTTPRIPKSIHRNDANMYQFLPISMRGPPGASPQRTAVDTEGEGVAPQSLPQGLPLVVQDAIRNQPSYGEGEVVPFAPNAYSSQYATNGSPLFEQEQQVMEQYGGPQRDTPLANEIGYDEYLRRRGVWPMPDTGVVGSMRQPGQSPFASPLNQLLQRRGPFALY